MQFAKIFVTLHTFYKDKSSFLGIFCMKELFWAVLSLLGFGGGNASSGVSDADWSETTMVVYRFGDSSVGPEYHRSFTLSVSAKEIKLSVDSYGTTLLKRRYANTPKAFLAFRNELAKKGIKKHKMVEDEGCSGGTTQHLTLYKNKESYFSAYVYNCDGESGTLTLPPGTAELICQQLPESLDLLINSTLEN